MIGVVARQLYINSNTNACLSIAFQENAKNYYFVNSTKPALHGVTFWRVRRRGGLAERDAVEGWFCGVHEIVVFSIFLESY